jgi:hypothetical protein
VDKTTAQQPKVQQFETDRRQRRKFSIKIPRPHNSSEVPKLKLFSQQFESTGFQDPQAAAETHTYIT